MYRIFFKTHLCSKTKIIIIQRRLAQISEYFSSKHKRSLFPSCQYLQDFLKLIKKIFPLILIASNLSMGNMSGAGLGMAIGAVGGPVGMAIGGAVGGTVGMASEITNGSNVYSSQSGDGGHHIGYISESVKSYKVRTIYVMKTDLCVTGLNTAASIGRAVFAPITTLTASNKSFWTEHWFVIFDVIGSGYMVSYKSVNGVVLRHVSTWEEALDNNGCTRRNIGEIKKYTYSSDRRTVQEIISYIRGVSSYYEINGNNCQDYANQVYSWF